MQDAREAELKSKAIQIAAQHDEHVARCQKEARQQQRCQANKALNEESAAADHMCKMSTSEWEVEHEAHAESILDEVNSYEAESTAAAATWETELRAYHDQSAAFLSGERVSQQEIENAEASIQLNEESTKASRHEAAACEEHSSDCIARWHAKHNLDEAKFSEEVHAKELHGAEELDFREEFSKKLEQRHEAAILEVEAWRGQEDQERDRFFEWEKDVYQLLKSLEEPLLKVSGQKSRKSE